MTSKVQNTRGSKYKGIWIEKRDTKKVMDRKCVCFFAKKDIKKRVILYEKRSFIVHSYPRVQ